MTAGTIRVGTSGWSYPHWRNRFYPKDVSSREWLDFYQRQFSTVEINATFYRLPVEKTVRQWHEEAPPRFQYVAKGSRYITHIRRLRDCAAPVGRLLGRLAPFKSALGVILWQLPPNFERDDTSLDAFLRTLPSHPRHAIEFRHPSWDDDEVYELLRRHNAAYVSASSTHVRTNRIATTDFVYVRFHGLRGGYAHDYTEAELRPWAHWLREQAAEGRNGYVFFNNDGEARAPVNAHRLIEMLGDAAFPWTSCGEA